MFLENDQSPPSARWTNVSDVILKYIFWKATVLWFMFLRKLKMMLAMLFVGVPSLSLYLTTMSLLVSPRMYFVLGCCLFWQWFLLGSLLIPWDPACQTNLALADYNLNQPVCTTRITMGKSQTNSASTYMHNPNQGITKILILITTLPIS